MNLRIVYQQVNGTAAVVIPAPNARLDGETDQEFAERIAAKDVPAEIAEVGIVDASALPSDRHFRNAWAYVFASNSLTTDMPKAREIHRENLRRAREKSLALLDVAWFQAGEQGNVALQATIASDKQALRDLPQNPAIETATTPAELKALWPTALGLPNPYT